ncbi:MAG: hypothetical protein LBF62_10785 [Tannerellaceae bacterium]|nr:hypothetical protein [Tannerellaceae bacterium]
MSGLSDKYPAYDALPTQIPSLTHALTQSADKWNSEMEETIGRFFNCYEELKKAYQICQLLTLNLNVLTGKFNDS